jgi:hypothetical protein
MIYSRHEWENAQEMHYQRMASLCTMERWLNIMGGCKGYERILLNASHGIFSVALLSSFMVQLRVGHIIKVLNIFSYPKSQKNSKIVFDPYPQVWDETKFQQFDWTDFYHNTKEAIPPNAPPPQAGPVQINALRLHIITYMKLWQ